MNSIKKDGFIFKMSKRKNKKYSVYKDGKYITSFGDNRYQQFKDKIGLYKHKDHNDKERRKRYYLRFGKETTKYTPKWFSHRYLW